MAGPGSNSSKAAPASTLLPPASQPLARAAFELAVLSSSGLAGSFWPRNDSLAVDWLHKSAEAGDIHASMALSYRYLHGKGVTGNCDQAFRYILSIPLNGFLKAISILQSENI